MEGKPNQADQHAAEPIAADEATIAEAWQQAAPAEHSPTLYKRFAAAYRELLALSRARRRRLLRGMGMTLAGAALAFALALGQVPGVRAAGISVGGGCTLVDAITAANTDTATGGCSAGSGADTITLSGNVTLTAVNNGISFYATGLPEITSAITIEGNGHTIARDGGAAAFRILKVATTGNLTLSNTTVSGGHSQYGGAIRTYGSLTLTNSTLSGNSAIGGGGGIDSLGGPITLTGSTVSGNSAGKGSGGIGCNGSVSGTPITITDSTISDNSAPYAAGIGIDNNTTLTLTNSTVAGNAATKNAGGILNGSNNSKVILASSTVSGNTAGISGGGIFNQNTLTLNNSTVTGNTASSDGGGIFNQKTLTLASSLISGNTAAGGREVHNVYQAFPIPPEYAQFCTLSGGTYRDGLCIIGGTVNSANYNLLGHSGASNAQSFTNFTPSGSDIISTSDGTNPTALASILNTTLADNGGPTLTHALVAGSPAVDAVPSGPATDQRGVARPQGAAFDIGAFELTALDQIDGLIAAVQALVDDGSLNGGQGNALITKLEHAADYVAGGQEAQAVSRMRTFISQVSSFIGSGVLTSAEGQPLIDAANAIIQSLGG